MKVLLLAFLLILLQSCNTKQQNDEYVFFYEDFLYIPHAKIFCKKPEIITKYKGKDKSDIALSYNQYLIKLSDGIIEYVIPINIDSKVINGNNLMEGECFEMLKFIEAHAYSIMNRKELEKIHRNLCEFNGEEYEEP
jgi:hypothetical protein